MRRIIKTCIIGFSLLLAMAACKEREAPLTPLGADIKTASGSFAITSAFETRVYETDVVPVANAVRFTEDSLYFLATFSEEVSWVIEITGVSSGAKKYIRGTSSSITKENSLWTGSHDELNFFRKNENATATLSFYGTDESESITINIVQSRPYGSLPGHFLMISTEDANGFDQLPSYPSWFGFDENGNTIQKVDEFGPQGFQGSAMRINGTNPNESDIFLNGARSGALGTATWNASQAYIVRNTDVQSGEYVGDPAKTDPDQVWVNVYVYIPEVSPSLHMEIQLKEADDDGKDGKYSDFEDDAWVHRVAYDRVGWKLVSFKYSDTWASAARDFGGNGNKVREPHRCMGFQFNIYSQVNGKGTWVAIDYPIFTLGGPFDPSK